MCIGSMCNGDPLPTTYRVVGTPQRFSYAAFPESLVINLGTAGTATYQIPTFSTGQIGGKLHNCPNCLCVQVNP